MPYCESIMQTMCQVHDALFSGFLGSVSFAFRSSLAVTTWI
ncbi:hypothetical protein ASZ90_017457 [hydrocarbon metagenome]|uniref:Uncharacterized protein n=1 Tax=hydrocarbon metagenome TaxID=938273 RepID=A0A0W8E970_9ZZZZ